MEAKLSKKPKSVEQAEKYIFKALTKFKIGDSYVYSVDATNKEKIQTDNDLKRALLKSL